MSAMSPPCSVKDQTWRRVGTRDSIEDVVHIYTVCRTQGMREMRQEIYTELSCGSRNATIDLNGVNITIQETYLGVRNDILVVIHIYNYIVYKTLAVERRSLKILVHH